MYIAYYTCPWKCTMDTRKFNFASDTRWGRVEPFTSVRGNFSAAGQVTGTSLAGSIVRNDPSHSPCPSNAEEFASLLNSLRLPQLTLAALIRPLGLFYEVGKRFEAGATSLSEVSRIMERESMEGVLASGLPYGKATLSANCAGCCVLFAQLIGRAGRIELFLCHLNGRSFKGLSAHGQVAWSWTRRMLTETD
jgi:hypothetical protein